MGFDTSQISQVGNIFSAFNTIQNKRSILTLSFKEAQDFKLNHGESFLALDPNEDILYVKECDDIGKCSLKIYSCSDVTAEYQALNTPSTLSKADLELFSQNILSEVKKMIEEKDNGKLNDKKQQQQ